MSFQSESTSMDFTCTVAETPQALYSRMAAEDNTLVILWITGELKGQDGFHSCSPDAEASGCTSLSDQGRSLPAPACPCLSPAPKQLFHPKKLERMLQETAALPSWLRSGKGREKNSCPWPPPTGPSRYPGNFRSHLTGARQRGQPPRAQTP